MKAARILAGIIAVVLVVAGAAVAVLLGPDDTWGGEPTALPDGAAPVVATAPRLLNVAGVDLVVSATAAEGEAFVGAGHPVHVQDYLGEVTRTEITGLSADGIGGSQQLAGERDYPAAPPSRLDVWDQQAQGREAAIEVPLTPDAPVQIAALPATAKGAAPQVGIGYQLPGAFVAGVVTALVGLLLLAAMILWGRRARRAAARRAEARSVERPAEQPAAPASLSRSATRVALVGTIAVLSTGCTVPQEVDHGDYSGVVPLEQADAQALLDDYDVRNNAAIKKSHTGDGSLWKSADTGPMLAQDELSARFDAYDKPKGAAKPLTHEGGRVYAPVQLAYPLWAAVEMKPAKPAKPAKDGAETLYVYTKDHAAGEWKASSSMSLADGLPTALGPEEAAPSSQDLERAEDVDTLLEAWAESGAVNGLVVDQDMKDARTELHKKAKGVERIADSADSWGGTRDTGDAQPAVRAIRVKEGLLVLSEIRWTSSHYLKADWTWNPSKREQAVYGNRANGNVSHRRCSLVAATLVPDTGDARVLGSSTSWVL